MHDYLYEDSVKTGAWSCPIQVRVDAKVHDYLYEDSVKTGAWSLMSCTVICTVMAVD